jgi:hypothetical protein
MKISIISTIALAALVAAFPAAEPAAVDPLDDVYVRDVPVFPDAADGIIDDLETRGACTRAGTDKLLFKDSMATFSAARAKKSPSCYDWYSEECTKSWDKPLNYNFKPSCRRHDFGLQNYHREGRCNAANKKKIDDNFKKDLYKECSHFKGLSSWRGVLCRNIADKYWAAVRVFGDC